MDSLPRRIAIVIASDLLLLLLLLLLPPLPSTQKQSLNCPKRLITHQTTPEHIETPPHPHLPNPFQTSTSPEHPQRVWADYHRHYRRTTATANYRRPRPSVLYLRPSDYNYNNWYPFFDDRGGTTLPTTRSCADSFSGRNLLGVLVASRATR